LAHSEVFGIEPVSTAALCSQVYLVYRLVFYCLGYLLSELIDIVLIVLFIWVLFIAPLVNSDRGCLSLYTMGGILAIISYAIDASK